MNHSMQGEHGDYLAYIDPNPATRGCVVVEPGACDAECLFELPLERYIELMLACKKMARHMCKKLGVERCALITCSGHGKPPRVRIIPLHGITRTWKPILSSGTEFCEYHPGYSSSMNGPRASSHKLDEMQKRIRKKLVFQDVSYEFDGNTDDNNLFARIVRGEEPQWRIWESRHHVALLTPYPNRPGFTVLVPRMHLSSDILRLDDQDYKDLLEAAYRVARLLVDALDARACCMVFEGLEVDYAHAKLIPIIESPDSRHLHLPHRQFHDAYPGYVSTLEGPPALSDEIRNLHSLLFENWDFHF